MGEKTQVKYRYLKPRFKYSNIIQLGYKYLKYLYYVIGYDWLFIFYGLITLGCHTVTVYYI